MKRNYNGKLNYFMNGRVMSAVRHLLDVTNSRAKRINTQSANFVVCRCGCSDRTCVFVSAR